MSDVKRFRADHRHVVETEFDDAQYVGVEDYDAKCHSAEVYFGSWKRTEEERDAAQVELAALREELANREMVRLEVAERFDDWMQRAIAAEQRNADDLRDAERYRGARKLTPYRFKKMQDASVTDGGDVLYFHADRFDALMDIELTKPTESGASE